MKKYNLTFWQRLELIAVWFIWIGHDKNNRKSWHEVKKGIEKHTCKFTKQFKAYGHIFYQCEHEGCNMSDDIKSE
jgi:hypothetical protein